MPPLKKVPSPGPGFFAAIVGAGQCSRTPRTCDLSHGIVTEPGNDSVVTCHLTRPDPDFLYKLALNFGFILPAGTPARVANGRPLPATGPYMVARYRHGHGLVLIRNPRFRSGRRPRKPTAFPTASCSASTSRQGRHVDAVLRGRRTRAPTACPRIGCPTYSSGTPPRRTASRGPATLPCGSTRVCRRSTTCGSAAPSTPQSIAPPSCAPRAARRRRAPRASTATRRRVGHSPHACGGMDDAALRAPGADRQGAPALARLPRSAQRDSEQRGPDEFAQFRDSRTRTQAGMLWWGADYPAASTFLAALFSCAAFRPASPGNLNWSEFCSPAIDAWTRSAARSQADNVQLANRK